MNCKHNDGWYLSDGEYFVINLEQNNDNLEALFTCNTIGCKEIKKFRFEIINIEEAKK